MKKITIGFIVFLLSMTGALWANMDSFADGDREISVEEIVGDDLPDDLSINMKSNYTDDVQDDFLEFYFGSSEKVDEYWDDYERISGEYSNCYNENITPVDQRESCVREAEKEIAEACIKYRLFVQMQYVEDIYLTTNGEPYQFKDGSISLNVHASDYDELYRGILEGMEEYGYADVKVEPLVIHKRHDGTYEYIDADYDVDMNSLRFTVDELSTFMITFAFLTTNTDDNSGNPATYDNTSVNVIIVATSAVSLFAMGVWIVKRENR